jgi:hypothetical protein
MDISNLEEIPRDMISLMHLITEKLTTIDPIHDTKTIEQHVRGHQQHIRQ